MVLQIKNGKRFKVEVLYEEIIANGYKVKFVHAKEDGRSVLRMIIPDKNGSLNFSEVDEFFKIQFYDLNSEFN